MTTEVVFVGLRVSIRNLFMGDNYQDKKQDDEIMISKKL